MTRQNKKAGVENEDSSLCSMHFGWLERISMGTSLCLFWLGQDRTDS
jgi:hypothetical protein